MLVSFNPSVSNNKFKSTSFKANPFVDTRKIASEAEAYIFEGHVIPSNRKILKTPEEVADLDYAIAQCLKRGQKTVAAILKRAKGQWQ